MSEHSVQAVIDHLLENDRFSAWLGIEVIEFEKGSCKICMKIREEMLNGFDIVHGGVTFAFADSALALPATDIINLVWPLRLPCPFLLQQN